MGIMDIIERKKLKAWNDLKDKPEFKNISEETFDTIFNRGFWGGFDYGKVVLQNVENIIVNTISELDYEIKHLEDRNVDCNKYTLAKAYLKVVKKKKNKKFFN